MVLAGNAVAVDGVRSVSLSRRYDLDNFFTDFAADLFAIDEKLSNDSALGGFYFLALDLEVDAGFFFLSQTAATLTQLALTAPRSIATLTASIAHTGSVATAARFAVFLTGSVAL